MIKEIIRPSTARCTLSMYIGFFIGRAQTGQLLSFSMVCPETGESFSIPEIRGDKRIDGKTIYGLRLWENSDLVPRPDDVFQERLYCVRWVETYLDTNAKVISKEDFTHSE